MNRNISRQDIVDLANMVAAGYEINDNANHAIFNAIKNNRDLIDIINRDKLAEEFGAKADFRTKQKVIADVRNQRNLEAGELRRVLFNVKPSMLMQRVRTYNSNHITLKINEQEVDLVSEPIKILIENIQEEDVELEGIDYIANKVNRAIVSKIEEEILNALTTTKAASVTDAIESLTDDSQRGATFIMNLKNYLADIDTFSKLNTIVVPTQENFVVDLSKVAVNYVVDKLSFDKDVKKGTYVAGCYIRNLKAKVLEEGAVASW